MVWGRKEVSCTSTLMLFNRSCLSIVSFAACALTKISVLVDALGRFGFDWAHAAADVTGGRSIHRHFTIQYAATPCRYSCYNVQYKSLVECDRKLNPVPRLWMLMISAAKLHIVCLGRNLGAIMYYLSFKVSILKITDAAYNGISWCRQAWFCQCVFQSFSALPSPITAETV